MKKLLSILLLVSVCLVANAVPAKRGQWQTLTLTDGSKVQAQLKGDEHSHYWMAADGRTFTLSSESDYAVLADRHVLEQQRQQRMARRQNVRNAAPRKAGEFGRPTSYKGSKKGVIILVEFPSKKFKATNTLDVFMDMANKEGYTDDYGSIGSVHDYFDTQSDGQFDLTFDVVGPVTASQEMKYYAGKGGTENVHKLIIEACQMVDDQVKWSDYDWNDDGYVDQVYVMYAGKGQADGGGAYTIWPHEYELSSALSPDGFRPGNPLELQEMKIDTYACGPELNGLGNRDGIGTLCHEFSHCLGLPDFYDTREDVDEKDMNYGMLTWSLMDYGCYNGDGYMPCNYTGYERWFCGWIEPTELAADTVVTDMKSLADYGDVFIIYNQAHRNEYLILQNIQQKGWDAEAYGNGLLVMHVDYDYWYWAGNVVNNTTDRQRCTVIPADNNFNTYFDNDISGDLYPTRRNKTLSNKSTPAALFYRNNTDDTKNANITLADITQNPDGTIAFNFSLEEGSSSQGGGDTPVIEPTDDYLFYESFDQCDGKGGNDGLWKNRGEKTQFVPDNIGWSVLGENCFGGSQCAVFGNSSLIGVATTPAFMLEGTTKLSFKAAAWGADKCSLVLSVNGTPYESFDLGNNEWTEYTVEITGEGATTLQFQPTKNRFFLDEVKVLNPAATTSVNNAVSRPLSRNRQGVWTLDGRYLGTDVRQLPPGIYIVNGRKVVK
jgi:M6 family metalloprotease-like protein